MTDHSDLIERLRKPAPKFGLEEFDPTYDVRQEAASALSSQSLIIENAALSSGASEIAGQRQLASDKEVATEILPGGQDCATALSEAREEIERLREALRKILWLRPPSFNAPKNKAATQMEIIARDALENGTAGLADAKGAEEIEVTDEMIEAGKEAANGWTDRYMDGAEFVNWDEALPEIFRRMLALVSGSREDGDG